MFLLAVVQERATGRCRGSLLEGVEAIKDTLGPYKGASIPVRIRGGR